MAKSRIPPATGAAAAAAVALAGAAAAGGKVVAQRRAEPAAEDPDAAYRLRGDEYVPDGVRRVARGRLTAARERLDAASANDLDEAVHEVRKDLKRLRACLRLGRDALGEETYDRENTAFRMAGRRLSGARDAQVLVETLDALTERFAAELPAAATQELRARLLADLERATAELRADDAAIETTRSELGRARTRTAWWTLETDGFAALKPGLRRIYRRARRRIRDACDDPATENLHEARKRVKDLWHATQLVCAAHPERLEAFAEQAHDVADLLGDDHDLAILRDVVVAHPQCFDDESSQRALLAVLDRRREALQRDALQRGRKLTAAKPRRFVADIERGWRKRAAGRPEPLVRLTGWVFTSPECRATSEVTVARAMRCDASSPGFRPRAARADDDGPVHRSLLAALLAAAALAAPATASAADALVAPDTAAQKVTALDGTVVWVTGRFGSQKLMQRTSDGVVSAVKGTRVARSYQSIDLGHDSDGGLLLTYLRCDSSSSCTALWNDLDGRRATFRNLRLKGCRLTTAPAQWRTRVAYGMACVRNGKADNARTGLYVKSRGKAPRQLPRPKDAIKFGARTIEAVDLRGSRVAALAADIYEYAFSESLTGKDIRSIFAAASEGDGNADASGVSLGAGGALWTLTNAEHLDDPKESIFFRLAGTCEQRENIQTPANGDYAATGLAVDGTTLYVIVPGAGIATHDFTPGPLPSC